MKKDTKKEWKKMHRDAESKIYTLEPGDATRYTLILTDLSTARDVISGIYENPEDYVLVTIIMPGGCGSSVLLKSELRSFADNPENDHIIRYAVTHGMESVYRYSLIVCLAAAGVLSYEEDENKAIAAMRRAITHM
jgi:hypothetical protein